MKIAFVVNVDWFFISHRLPLAKYALERGDEVFLLTADSGRKTELEVLGIRFVEIPFQRSGSNPFHEAKCIRKLKQAYTRIQPDVVHHITLKAALLGSIAAKLTGQKRVVNAISGFGYNFTDERKGVVPSIVKTMIRIAFKSTYFQFILQNPDDVATVKSLKLVPDENVNLIKGSGVDLKEYYYSPLIQKEKIEVLFPARILRDKGVVELIEAANILRGKYEGKVRFVLAGDCDEENPAVLHEDELKPMLIGGYIDWVGYQKKMVPLYQKCDIVALPSYREGLPKSLIEACAIGRPIVTTDTIGCKECVDEGINGFKIPIKSIEPMADVLKILIDDFALREKMGLASRKKAEEEFSIENVIYKTFAIYNQTQA